MRFTSMEPVTLLAIAVIVSAGAGFGAGWGLKPHADTEEILHAHSQSLDAVLDGQTEMLTEITRPVVIDAGIRDKLSDIPPACGASGDPMSVACMVQACWAYGQSAAQRPECSDLQDELVRLCKEQCAEEVAP